NCVHPRFGGETATETVFELMPRSDGSFYIEGDNGLYVSVINHYDLRLGAAKSTPDIHCVFLIRNPSDSRTPDDVKSSAALELKAEAGIAKAQIEA
ncbi:hypothetical protein BGZ82_003538, partial [Podila clonocystis]